MENLEKEAGEKTEDSELYAKVMEARATCAPQTLRELTSKLEAIAEKMGLGLRELLEKAEHSVEFREEFLEARNIARRISILKK